MLCTGLARKRSGNVVGNGRLISKQQLSFAGDGAMHASSCMVLDAGGLPVALSCFFATRKTATHSASNRDLALGGTAAGSSWSFMFSWAYSELFFNN